MSSSVGLPLQGVLVVDFTVTLPGPYCSSLLARLGARVIRVEPPRGDPTRTLAPAVHDALNRGKESVVADLKQRLDIELVRRIAASADVVIEGWRPGVAERLGVGPEDLRARNDALVYCSISGFGCEGELRDRPGHDINYLAASGATALLFEGRAPDSLGVPIADLAGGTIAATRIVAALLHARTSGEGAFLDIAITGAVRDWVDALGGPHAAAFTSALRLPHYGIFGTRDGYSLSLGTVHEDTFWSELCHALGMDDVAGLPLADRAAMDAELRARIAATIGGMDRGAVEEKLRHADTCWAFVDSPAAAQPAAPTAPAPQLGAHTNAVAAEFQTSWASEGSRP